MQMSYLELLARALLHEVFGVASKMNMDQQTR